MQNWTIESLTRALISAALVVAALFSCADWLRIGGLAALVVFLFFLLRNPQGWARRIAYTCAMLGAAILMQLGSAIKGTGWFEAGGWLENVQWLAGFVVTIDEGSLGAGLVLLITSAVFGLFELVRQSLSSSPPNNGRLAWSIPTCRVQRVTRSKLHVSCIVPLKNHRPYEVGISEVNLSRRRLLDFFMVKSVRVISAVAMEVIGNGASTEQVEFDRNFPARVPQGNWKKFRVTFEFEDRLGRPHRFLKPLFWVFGLNYRLFNLKLGEGDGGTTFTKPILARL